MWDFDIDIVVKTVIDQMEMFNCGFDEAWIKYMHPLITDQFSLIEVRNRYLELKNNQ